MGYLVCVHDLKIEQHVHTGREGQTTAPLGACPETSIALGLIAE